MALLLLSFLTSPLSSRAQVTSVRYLASAAEFYYFGRMIRGDAVLWTWPGMGLRVSYSGSRSASLHFRADNVDEPASLQTARMIWYRIDGGGWVQQIIPPGMESDYTLIVPNDKNKHMLEVVKSSEGQLTFSGIVLEAGGKLAKPPAPSRRIEIVGDSITAGFRVNGEGSFNVVSDHDARLTYGWLIGERLDAEIRLIAVTGHGVVHDFGSPPEASRTMPQYYPTMYRAYDAPNDWSWQPDMVIVNLGSNDLGPPGITSGDVFQTAYTTFLTDLRQRNPKALIIALQPFGVANGSYPVYPNEIRSAVTARRNAGDQRVTYIDTAGWLGPGDFTDGTHPNATGNRKAADKLLAVLQNGQARSTATRPATATGTR
ncbi:MAG: hypothetical protein IT324_04115 [Anaerolineae bacterium]|nr:hypothetical protein [Anaerolineae bacterium]